MSRLNLWLKRMERMQRPGPSSMRRVNRIGIARAARLAQRRDVIDVYAEANHPIRSSFDRLPAEPRS